MGTLLDHQFLLSFFFHCEHMWEWWSHVRYTHMDVPRFMSSFQHTDFNSVILFQLRMYIISK